MGNNFTRCSYLEIDRFLKQIADLENDLKQIVFQIDHRFRERKNVIKNNFILG